MNRPDRLRSLGLGLLVAVGLHPLAALACSCAPVLLAQRFESSENVFSAIITGATASRVPGRSTTQLQTAFLVTEQFKGRMGFEHLASHADGGSCGISLQVGVEYLATSPRPSGFASSSFSFNNTMRSIISPLLPSTPSQY